MRQQHSVRNLRTPPVPYWLWDPQLRAAEAHARTQRLAKQATEKAEAERNAATREYREQQEQVLERMKTLREARLAAGGVGAGDVGVESARGGSQNKRPG